MTTWHFNSTWEHVSALFGEAQLLLAKDSIQSLVYRQNYCRYHYKEIQRLTEAFEQEHLPNNILIEIYADETKWGAFNDYIIEAGAHAVAAVQSLHAIPDLLAHAVYFALGANLGINALKTDRVSISSVPGVLKANPIFQNLHGLLSAVNSGNDWDHLAAVSNQSKHRNVVRAKLSEDMTGTRKNRRELHFHHFVRDGKTYPSCSYQDILEPEFNRLSIAIVDVGHELDTCLQTMRSKVGK